MTSCYIPKSIVAMKREVKQSRKGLYFHYGCQRVYLESEIKKISLGDEIQVLLLGAWSDSHQRFLVSKDFRTWYLCEWKDQELKK